MPNRILRDWTDSEKIDMLDVYSERFFTRLIMKVDDYGRYNANLKFLKSTLFPLKTDVSESDVANWLNECQKEGLIVLYSVKGKDYVQIENFKQVLRQKVVKYPSIEDSDKCYADAKHMLSNCLSSASLNRIETNRIESETEVEVESGKNDFPPTPPPSYQTFTNDQNAWNLFDPANTIQREALMISLQLRASDTEILKSILRQFNIHRNSEGKLEDTYKDYMNHLNNWKRKAYEVINEIKSGTREKTTSQIMEEAQKIAAKYA